MAIKLTDEELQMLKENPTGIRCEDDTTQRVYFLMDESVHSQAIAALRERQEFKELKISIAQADAGQVMPLDEADAQLRAEFGLPHRK
jgi:predicted transcriptional regulator